MRGPALLAAAAAALFLAACQSPAPDCLLVRPAQEQASLVLDIPQGYPRSRELLREQLLESLAAGRTEVVKLESFSAGEGQELLEVLRECAPLAGQLQKLAPLERYYSSPLPAGARGLEESPLPIEGQNCLAATFRAAAEDDGRLYFLLVNRDLEGPNFLRFSPPGDPEAVEFFNVAAGEWSLAARYGVPGIALLPPGGGVLFRTGK